MGNGVAKMAACTLEKSGGKLKIQPFYDGALGNDIAATQSVRTGSLDMVITSTAPLVGIAAVDRRVRPAVPVQQRDARPTRCSTARSATASRPSCRRVGLVNLAWWENGFRHTTNSKRADHQGSKTSTA